MMFSKRYKTIATCALLAATAVLIQNNVRADDELARKLSSQDNAIRREASLELMKLALKKEAKSVVKVAEITLGSKASPGESKVVALDALTVIARETAISHRYMRERSGLGATQTPGALEVSAPAELRGLLMKIAQSPDPVLREKVIRPLVGLYPPASDIERLLIARLTQENVPAVQSTLVQAFGLGGYKSQESFDALFQVLTTSDADDLRGYAAIELGHLGVHPSRVLPVLFDLLKPEFSFLSGSVLQAIALYGDAASPYIERLEQLAGSASDQNLKNQIESTIRAIRSSGETKIAKREPVTKVVGKPTADGNGVPAAGDADEQARARWIMPAVAAFIGILLVVGIVVWIRLRKGRRE